MGEFPAQPDAVVGFPDKGDLSPVPQDGDQSSGSTAPDGAPATPLSGGTESRPRSGFARQKIKIARLTNDLEILQSEYWRLQDDHERLRISHDKIEADYSQLEVAFAEITQLNSTLSAELRQVKQHRPSPAFGSLMGIR
jgi:hypothetical protein